MTVADKLQIKDGQRAAVLNAPPDVDLELPGGAEAEDPADADAVVVFVTDRQELDDVGAPAFDAGRRDTLTWVAYPKAGQRGTDLNRDTLNAAMNERGLQAVRQVSIDDVWSALRFRPR